MALSYAIIVTVQKFLVSSVPAAALQFTFTAYAFPFFVLLAAALKSIQSVAAVLDPKAAAGAAFVGVCASLDYYFAFASLKYVSTLLVGLANSLLPLFVVSTVRVCVSGTHWNKNNLPLLLLFVEVLGVLKFLSFSCWCCAGHCYVLCERREVVLDRFCRSCGSSCWDGHCHRFFQRQ